MNLCYTGKVNSSVPLEPRGSISSNKTKKSNNYKRINEIKWVYLAKIILNHFHSTWTAPAEELTTWHWWDGVSQLQIV